MGEANSSQFCETVLNRLAETEAKLEEWKQIAKEYNAGLLVPELKAIKGERQNAHYGYGWRSTPKVTGICSP